MSLVSNIENDNKWILVIKIIQIYFLFTILRIVVSFGSQLYFGHGLTGAPINMEPSEFFEIFFMFSFPLICASLFLLLYVWKTEKSLKDFGFYLPLTTSGRQITLILFLALIAMLIYLYIDHPEAVLSYGLAYIMVGISEEFLFRGYIQAKLQHIINKYAALLITSFLFAFAMHSGFSINLFIRLPLGLLFGFLFLKYKSVWPGVIVHSGYDIFVVLNSF